MKYWKLLALSFAVLCGFSVSALADFSGAYDPVNWTLTLSPNSNGSVDTSGAPASISMTGSDGPGGGNAITDYTATIACPGPADVSFTWDYVTFDVDGSSFDPAGYLIDGAFTQVTTDGLFGAQSGVVSLFGVPAGATFGFRILATDNVLGPGVYQSLYNFEVECQIVANDDDYSTLEDTTLNVPAPGVLANDIGGAGGGGGPVNVGYYDMSAGQGAANQVASIVAAGHNPVQILDLSAAELAGIDVLYVQNPSNGDYGAEYVAQVPAIEAAVGAGLNLIIHDRYVTPAETILPGGAGFDIIRDFTDDANIDILDDTTLVTNGPGGVLDNTSLDGGNSSSHGFAVAGSLPGDSVNILSRTASSEIVTVCYGFGGGSVTYSTIPLDFYLAGAGANPPADNFRNIYAPNVVAYGAAGACAGLTAVLVDPPLHGDLTLNPDGSFEYIPNPNYCGPDSFTYYATDGVQDSNIATVSIDVECVNDPPVITLVDPAAQTSDYSDYIGSVTIEAFDIDDTSLTLGQTGAPAAIPYPDLNTTTVCVVVPNDSIEDGSVCSWTMDGQVLDPGDNVNNIVFTANDGEADSSNTGLHTLTVEPEDATVTQDPGNIVAVEVAEDGGDSIEFTLFFSAVETLPDLAGIGTPEHGDLNLMVPYMDLIPVGPGGPVPGVCDFIEPTDTGDEYDQVAMFECVFVDVPVNTYEVVASVDGASDTTRYYAGSDDGGVLVVYDPSLGFTTGGGWFYWPGTADPDLLTCGEDGYPGDKTNFGFNMKYNKKMTNVQGSLLLQRHTVDANCEGAGKYRVKSNALNGLSIGDATDDTGEYGWAAFSGKSVFNEPNADSEGNHPFLVYVEDHGDQGGGQDPADEFWIEVQDKDGNVVLEVNGPDSVPAGEDGADGDDEPIHNGNIVVPH
jgi:hypothetical protein